MPADFEELELESAIGFNGRVPGGLLYHPDGNHIIYPLGATIVVKDLNTDKQTFLSGHTDSITALCLSRKGDILASGQQTHPGMKADIILWDFATLTLKKKLRPEHNVKVQAIAFNCTGTVMASLGGCDDNKLVLWSMMGEKATYGKALQKVEANTERALTLQFYNNKENYLVTGGNHHLRRWKFDLDTFVPTAVDANMGTLRRIFKTIAMSEDDAWAYAGTSTGDLLQVAMEPETPAFKRGSCELFSMGIRSVCWMRGPKGPIVVLGNGDGSVVQLNAKTLKKEKTGSNLYTASVMGSVTSVAPMRRGIDGEVGALYFGTNESNIYTCKLKNFDKPELLHSCHPYAINDVTFMDNFPNVFITCSNQDLRVWNTFKKRENLRIQVPNVECTCVTIPNNGAVILSGWSDGKIRAFLPQTGQLDWVINDAHPSGVTAVAVTHDNLRIISGGQKGQVRFWSMSGRKMQASLKEHKDVVNSICVRTDNKECVTSSNDGSCIVWNLDRNLRSMALFASTMFKCIKYHPDESQFLTCGSDRKVTYWDTYDGSAIRIMDGSKSEIKCLDIDKDGTKYVHCGHNLRVTVCDYDTGAKVAVGVGHSGAINGVRIAPDQSRIISVGSEGGIFVWSYVSQRANESKLCD